MFKKVKTPNKEKEGNSPTFDELEDIFREDDKLKPDWKDKIITFDRKKA